jgi:hypothetical protein
MKNSKVIIETEKYRHSSPVLLEVEVQKLLPLLTENLIPGQKNLKILIKLSENYLLAYTTSIPFISTLLHSTKKAYNYQPKKRLIIRDRDSITTKSPSSEKEDSW